PGCAHERILIRTPRNFVPRYDIYSCRNASTGSNRAARNAGTTHAASVTTPASNTTATYVTGSNGSTSYTIDPKNPDANSAPPIPNTSPTADIASPCDITSRITCAHVAPSAIRNPISCVLRPTRNEITA